MPDVGCDDARKEQPLSNTSKYPRLWNGRRNRLPRWLRGLAAVGLAPIPGPVDELVLLVVAAVLWLGYRDRLRAAWRNAA